MNMPLNEKGLYELKKYLADMPLNEPYIKLFQKHSELNKYKKGIVKIRNASIFNVFEKMVETKSKFNLGQLFAVGFNARIFSTFEGIISEVAEDRVTSATILLRSQIENIAIAHKLAEDVKYVDKLYSGEHTNVLTLIEKVSKKYSGLDKDYEAYCEFAHPNEKAMFQNFIPLDEKGYFNFSNRGTGFKSKADLNNFFEEVIIWTDWAQSELKIFINKT